MYFGRIHTKCIIPRILEIVKDMYVKYDYIIIEGGHEFKDENMNVEEFIDAKSDYYKSIQFNDIIENRVKNFDREHNLAEMIGIHIET